MALRQTTTGRNYSIDRWVKPELTWQPGTQYRVAMELRYTDKVNALALEAEATIESITGSFRWEVPKKKCGRTPQLCQHRHSGTGQNALAFAMLRAWYPGAMGLGV